MSVDCNILKYSLSKSRNLLWGTSCLKEDCALINDYIDYLNCDSKSILKPSNKIKQKTNEVIDFTCTTKVLRSRLEVEEDIFTFTFQSGDIVGGTPPYTYQWTFSTSDFEASGPTNKEVLVLKKKSGKDFNLMISEIKVEIVDAEGCRSEKSCWIDKGEYKCHNNFRPCFSPKTLTVESGLKICTRPKTLVVTNI